MGLLNLIWKAHIKFSKLIMNKQLYTQGSSFVLNVFSPGLAVKGL